MPRPKGADAGERRLRIVLGLLIVGLVVFTALAFFTPYIGIAFVNERLDLIINTGATLGAGAIAALAWARYRITAEGRAFYQAGAFLTLASVNAGVLTALALDRGPELGFSLDDPGPLPVISFVLARLVAAALLLIGGLAAIRRTVLQRRQAALLVLAPSILTLTLLGILRRGELSSPLSAEALGHLQRLPGQPIELSLLSTGLIGVQLAIGGMFLGAAWLAYRTCVSEDRPADAYLAAGFILAGFSQVHQAVNPGSYASLVTTGDLLRVIFYGALLAGVIVQSRSDARAIQVANEELRLLRDAEIERALLEERAHLAREVHDGLAQDLWYARLKQGRLAQLVVGDEEKALAQDVMDAIDSGIADARQTVMAMRAATTDSSLLEVIERYVDDFGDRFALDARFESSGSLPQLSARAQAEILRIIQEALNNVRKHADATVIRVRAAVDDGTVLISVSDNGRGFATGGATDGFGLVSMRERAGLIGAALDVRSAPADGTRVTLSIPMAGARG